MYSLSQVVSRSRLLLVDDDPDIHELVFGILQSDNIEIFTAIDGEAALQVARRERPDLILLDFELPGANGLEVLASLRSGGVPRSTPVIFITGNDSHKVLTACFQAGAADYIRKPFCVPELLARVVSVLDRKHMLAQLERLALHDQLTNMFNRTSIRDRIQIAINRVQTSNYALLFLDFDRFKQVNDRLGHEIGDQLLQQIADRMRGALRSTDVVSRKSDRTTAARLGGDEFVVLLEGVEDPNDALLVADRLLTTLAIPYSLAGQEICCTASIGVVNSLQRYATPDDVLRDADSAMYKAKSAGRGRCVLFDPSIHGSGA